MSLLSKSISMSLPPHELSIFQNKLLLLPISQSCVETPLVECPEIPGGALDSKEKRTVRSPGGVRTMASTVLSFEHQTPGRNPKAMAKPSQGIYRASFNCPSTEMQHSRNVNCLVVISALWEHSNTRCQTSPHQKLSANACILNPISSLRSNENGVEKRSIVKSLPVMPNRA